MKKTLLAAALVGGFGFATQSQAALVQIQGPEDNGLFDKNECQGVGFASCFATQSGTNVEDGAKPSNTIFKQDSDDDEPTGDQALGNYPFITGAEFEIVYDATLNTLSFEYTPGAGDPAIHYVAIFQAGSHALFYSPTSVLTGSFSLSDYWRQPGWSHITFFNGAVIIPPDPGVPAPEPMSLALFGLGLAGLGVASRRRKASA